MADWDKVEVQRVEWNNESGAGSQPFRLRECPECCALVRDDDEAQDQHRRNHIVGPILGGNFFGKAG